MKKIILILTLFFCCSLNAQTDWVKWGKVNLSYAKTNKYSKRDYLFTGENITQTMINSFISTYWIFISDLDGDNCPFRPSCSSFFLEAVQETNLPQGILIFVDRFTRDLNIFGRMDKYPRFGPRHFYDPVYLYTLNKEGIKYLPSSTFIKSE